MRRTTALAASWTMIADRRSTRWALALAASLLAASQAAAGGPTVTVPGDYATIQEAIDVAQNDLDPGEVIVESDGVFDEAVLIQQSVTLRAGEGFSPTIERNGTVSGPLRISAAEDQETEVVVVGAGAGSPVCLRLEPFGFGCSPTRRRATTG